MSAVEDRGRFANVRSSLFGLMVLRWIVLVRLLVVIGWLAFGHGVPLGAGRRF
jgi:hypothetical protein